MAKITLNVGSNANDGTGDTLRSAMQNVNTMFTELYESPLFSGNITVSGNNISANRSNDDLEDSFVRKTTRICNNVKQWRT